MQKLSKKERSRQKIMHAAKGLFEKYGIDDVTFNQIADEAEVCRTTVFNHFAGISELMLAISSQEAEDIREFCMERELKGLELIYGLYDKLIEDTAYYPMLASRLANNAILSNEKDNPVKIIEEMTVEGLESAGTRDAQNIAILIEGAYYGIINHYHINNKSFDKKCMQEEFHRLLGLIIKEGSEL